MFDPESYRGENVFSLIGSLQKELQRHASYEVATEWVEVATKSESYDEVFTKAEEYVEEHL